MIRHTSEMKENNKRLSILLIQCIRILKKSAFETLSKYNLTLGQWYIIRELLLKKILSINELCALTDKSKSEVSQITYRLEKRNIIKKMVDPNDHRMKKIQLTKEGRKLTDILWEEMKDHETKLLRKFTKREINDFKKYLSKFSINS